MARHGGSDQHGSGHPHSPWREGTTENSLACRLRLFDVTQFAQRLKLPQKWVYTPLRRGVLESSGRYLFPDTESPMQAIRELREHRTQRVDLTGGSA
jgi:hypothetical protein